MRTALWLLIVVFIGLSIDVSECLTHVKLSHDNTEFIAVIGAFSLILCFVQDVASLFRRTAP